jgi:hypothetical protein
MRLNSLLEELTASDQNSSSDDDDDDLTVGDVIDSEYSDEESDGLPCVTTSSASCA